MEEDLATLRDPNLEAVDRRLDMDVLEWKFEKRVDPPSNVVGGVVLGRVLLFVEVGDLPMERAPDPHRAYDNLDPVKSRPALASAEHRADEGLARQDALTNSLHVFLRLMAH